MSNLYTYNYHEDGRRTYKRPLPAKWRIIKYRIENRTRSLDWGRITCSQESEVVRIEGTAWDEDDWESKWKNLDLTAKLKGEDE